MTTKRKLLHAIVLVFEGICSLVSVLGILLLGNISDWNIF